MIRAAVIGYGYWGPNIVRNFRTCGAIDLVCVCDQAPKQLERVRGRPPGPRHDRSSLRDVLDDPSDRRGRRSSPRSRRTSRSARRRRSAPAQARVDREAGDGLEQTRRAGASPTRPRASAASSSWITPFIYTGAVRKLRELADDGEIGALVCYDSARTNLGLYRPDVNVLLGPRGPRLVDHGLRPRPEGRGGVGDRPRQRAGDAGEHRVHDLLPRGRRADARARGLVLPREGAHDDHHGRQEDDRVRRQRAGGEGQGLRSRRRRRAGRGGAPPRDRLPPGRRDGARAREARGAERRRAALRRGEHHRGGASRPSPTAPSASGSSRCSRPPSCR